MRIKLDENVPTRLSSLLANMGHDVDTVQQENLKGHDDSEIWEAVQKDQRFLITQDLDFSDTRKFTAGTHCGILLVRLRDTGRNALLQRLLQVFQRENVETWKSCFVVLTESKIRIRRPVG